MKMKKRITTTLITVFIALVAFGIGLTFSYWHFMNTHSPQKVLSEYFGTPEGEKIEIITIYGDDADILTESSAYYFRGRGELEKE